MGTVQERTNGNNQRQNSQRATHALPKSVSDPSATLRLASNAHSRRIGAPLNVHAAEERDAQAARCACIADPSVASLASTPTTIFKRGAGDGDALRAAVDLGEEDVEVRQRGAAGVSPGSARILGRAGDVAEVVVYCRGRDVEARSAGVGDRVQPRNRGEGRAFDAEGQVVEEPEAGAVVHGDDGESACVLGLVCAPEEEIPVRAFVKDRGEQRVCDDAGGDQGCDEGRFLGWPRGVETLKA